MKAWFGKSLVVVMAMLGGGLALWAGYRGGLSQKGALCVLQLKPGVPVTNVTFTTSNTIPGFRVALRPAAHRERLSIAISGTNGLLCRVTMEATEFGCGGTLPPATYSVQLSQHTGTHGGMAIISDRKPAGITGWQIMSRLYLAGFLAAGIWALATRQSPNLVRRALSTFVFQRLLLGFVLMVVFLFFHEGGHSLIELLLGRYDFATSDFWGWRGHPHSGGKGGPSIQPWQQALISGNGIMFPTVGGWITFVLWNAASVRNFRAARPTLNVFLSATVAILLFPFIVVPGYSLGLISDGDWRGFINNVPGPLWLIHAGAWAMLIVNGLLLWRVLPELWQAWKAEETRLRQFTASS